MSTRPTRYETGYNSGYRAGQADLVDYLRGELDEVHADIACEFSLWCIGWNLSLAGALKTADLKGKAAATGWNYGSSNGYRRDEWETPKKYHRKF